MQKVIFFFLLITILFTSCSAPKKTNTGTTTQMVPSATSNPPEDGLSFATAVVVKETTESAGVKAEYKWVNEHYPGFKMKSQALNRQDKKPYDTMTIVLTDSKELKLYFDISNFFGKF